MGLVGFIVERWGFPPLCGKIVKLQATIFSKINVFIT